MNTYLKRLGIPLGPWTVNKEGYPNTGIIEEFPSIVNDEDYTITQLCDLVSQDEIDNTAEFIAVAPEMFEVILCQAALDMPLEKGLIILKECGWNYNNRFELSASEFVKQKRETVFNKITKGKII